jgi:predicted nucleotidyltransferase
MSRSTHRDRIGDETAALAGVAEREQKAIVSAYVFGSVAEGRAHRESDVDVAVLLARDALPTAAERFEVRLRLSSLLSARLERTVDLVVLNDVPPGLGRHVVTRGTRVLLRDPEADHAFVRDVQLRAADLEPFLRRLRRVKLEALARP